MEKPFYITTPIYYVNDDPHLGHAYTTVLADTIARYRRIAGEEVFFLTGTDEHGQKIAEAAAARGMSPKQHCDLYVKNFKNFWRELDIQYDHFIRTTDREHKNAIQKALMRLWELGEIYQDEYSGWYCTPCERFWTEKDVEDGLCPDCKRPVKELSEKNYFFRMSKHQDWLIEHIEKNPHFIRPESRRNEILGFLRQPLNDLCISRPKDRLSWGIELPFDKDFVCYVWFDALMNYVTAIGWPERKPNFEYHWPADVHLMAKDIITTHAVYWPTMLHALGIEPPRTVFSHGWWMVEEVKMGKSMGNAVPIPKLLKLIGRDALRYFLIRDSVISSDSQFTFEGLIRRINTDLANDLGNLTSRVLGLIHQNFDGVVPVPGKATEDEIALKNTAIAAAETLRDEVMDFRLSRGLEAVNGLVSETNRYLENTAPWNLAKQGDWERLETVLYNAAEALRVASILLWPVMPDACDEIRKRLGIEKQKILLENAMEWGLLKSNRDTYVGLPLFPRIDEEAMMKDLREEEHPLPSTETAEGLIDIGHFAKIQLALGKVIECENMPKADRLLILKVDLGTEIRQIIAGIAPWYMPEELIGKTIVIVLNLEPVKIRGYESRGMLLAAGTGDVVKVLTVDGELPPGTAIK
ncbi:MAG TPA: methionine--tRNA ligase [candidate division Zixibacteria bacterium]|nr:methionine--tRNA ligase [candidate division Zixibacteria bacterium]